MRHLFLFSILFFIYSCSSDDSTEEIASLDDLIHTVINADHATDEIEFRLRRSIWAIEDLIYWYAEHDWNTEELERQIFEKIDQLIALYIEKGWDMSELEKMLVNLERRLESLIT